MHSVPGASLVEATYDVSKNVYNGEDVQSAVVKRYAIQLFFWSLTIEFFRWMYESFEWFRNSTNFYSIRSGQKALNKSSFGNTYQLVKDVQNGESVQSVIAKR